MSKQTIFILGGTGGIGSALLDLLLQTQDINQLVIFSRHNKPELSNNSLISHYSVDATDSAALESIVEKAVSEHGNPQSLVNCIGSILIKPPHLTSYTDWQQTLALNLTTAFSTVRLAGKFMAEQGGSVVLMSTCAARIGLANHEAIAAAKAGVEGLMRSAATTYAPKIRFNCVAPGLVKTPLSEFLLRSPQAEQTSIALHPLKRLGEPQEVARMIAWLIQPDNTWITGQVFGIDGGLSTIKNVR